MEDNVGKKECGHSFKQFCDCPAYTSDWRERFENDIWPVDNTMSLGSNAHSKKIAAFIEKELERGKEIEQSRIKKVAQVEFDSGRAFEKERIIAILNVKQVSGYPPRLLK